MKNLTIRTILLAIICFMGILASTGLSVITWKLWQKRLAAIEVTEINQAGDMLINSAGHWAAERGLTNTALSLDIANAGTLPANIADLRDKGDTSFQEAMTAIQNGHNFPDKANLIKNVEATYTAIQNMRQRVDQQLTLPLADRQTSLAQDWVAAMTRFIRQTQSLRLAASDMGDKMPADLQTMMQLKHDTWVMSEYAGRERAMLGGILANAERLNGSQVETLYTMRGHVEEAWNTIQELTSAEDTDPRIVSAAKLIEDDYFDNFAKGARSKALHAAVDGIYTSPAQQSKEWVKDSTSAIDGLLAFGRTVSTVAAEQAKRIAGVAAFESLLSACALLICLGVSGFALYVVLRRVIAPLLTMTRAMTDLSAGNLEVSIPPAGRDEIGRMAKALQVFKDNAIAKAEAERQKIESDRQAAIMSSCLTNLKNNVMIADNDDNMSYMNIASKEALEELAPEIRKVVPDFDPNKIMGTTIHQFHADHERVKRVLRNLKEGEIHTRNIKIGSLTLLLNVGPIFQNGTRIGSYAEWRDITAELAAKTREQRVQELVGQTSSMINDAVRDIAQGNLNLSERTEAQAASIEETTATMQQVTERVAENARNAQEALLKTHATLRKP